MKRAKIYTIAFSFLLILCVGAIVVPAEYFVLERRGSIEWGQKATHLKLKKYELIGRPDELRSWLLQADGAPGQEVAVAFLSWGIDNQDDFERILEGTESKRRAGLIVWLSGVIIERGFDESFKTSFSGRSSPMVQVILKEIDSTSDGLR